MLHITQIDNGVFDLRFDSLAPAPSGLDEEQALLYHRLCSLVYTALFTDAATDKVDREPDRALRQGWWLDPTVGSALWHIRRQPLSPEARLEALEEVRSRLNDCAPALEELSVDFVSDGDAAGVSRNVSGVFLKIAGRHNGVLAVVQIPLF